LKPLLKWVGGKAQLIDAISERLPETFDTYHEPFLGGGALYFHLAPRVATISDFNPRLVDFYSLVRDHPREVFEECSEIKDRFDGLPSDDKSTLYYELRKEFNETRGQTIRNGALFLFLNKAGFNGLFRENRDGNFNVPFGQKKFLSIPEFSHFIAAANQLKTSVISHGSYESVLDRAKAGDFVYLDPPYVPLKGSPSFTSYLSSGFGPKEQGELASVFSELSDAGVHVMASNSFTETVRKLYARFDVRIVNARRNINSVGSRRGRVEEALITNY